MGYYLNEHLYDRRQSIELWARNRLNLVGKCSQHIIKEKVDYKAVCIECSSCARKKRLCTFFNWKNTYKNVNSAVSGY